MSHQLRSASQPQSAASKLFDLRLMIGGLFILYGGALVVAGLIAPSVAENRASGININLWMGIGMFVVGVVFLLWWRLQPVRPPSAPEATRRQLPATPPESRAGQAAPRAERRKSRPRSTRR